MNIDTPRTDLATERCSDKYHRLYPDSKNKPVDDDFARILERELTTANQKIQELEKDKERLLNVLEHCALDPANQPPEQHLVASMVVKELRTAIDSAIRQSQEPSK